MSALKTERLLNLHIMLLSARDWISRQRIRETIEGYRGLDDGNFERTFERDKKDLRAAGIPLETAKLESDEPGYRIRRSNYELPAISFTPAEVTAISAASQVWQDQLSAASTREGLAALLAAGCNPDPTRLIGVQPRMAGVEGLDVWLTACQQRQRVRFGYQGQQRLLEPWQLHQRRGQWYVLGFDVDRQACRRFKLSRLSAAPKLTGAPEAFETPTQPVEFTPEVETKAVVAIRQRCGQQLVKQGTAIAHADTPEGFNSFELPLTPVLVGEICALGVDAIALEPQTLVADVVAQLRFVAERWAQ